MRSLAAQRKPSRSGGVRACCFGSLLGLSWALWAAGSGAALAKIAEVGPEDVPADNRFDTAQMNSSLVVAHTEVTRFRYPVIDAHSHDSYATTSEEVLAWVALQKQVNVAQSFIFTGKSGEEFRTAVARYAARYPGRFVMFAGISADGIGTPGYGELLRARLKYVKLLGTRKLREPFA